MEESQVLKRTLAGLALICCIGALSLSASALAPCDKNKQCSAHAQKVAQVTSKSQCSKAAASKVAQVTSDRQAQCAAAKAGQVAQVRSGSDCPYAAKVAQVAQVTSDKQAQCAAAKAAQVAQIKSGNASPQCSKAAAAAKVAQVKSVAAACAAACATQAAKVAQVKSGSASACCGACNGAAKAVQAKYVAFGCTKTDAAVRKAAYAYLKAVAHMQEKSGAKGCALEAATKTLAAVVSEQMAEYQSQAASAKSAAPGTTSISFGAVSECGPDCTKACCTK